jgi:hypothetical protein
MANCRNSFGAVRVLADRGHGRLTLLNGPSHDSTARERPRGYTDAFEQAGLALRQECVRLGTFSREHGRRAIRGLMSLPEPPEAIFSSSAIRSAPGAEGTAPDLTGRRATDWLRRPPLGRSSDTPTDGDRPDVGGGSPAVARRRWGPPAASARIRRAPGPSQVTLVRSATGCRGGDWMTTGRHP